MSGVVYAAVGAGDNGQMMDVSVDRYALLMKQCQEFGRSFTYILM